MFKSNTTIVKQTTVKGKARIELMISLLMSSNINAEGYIWIEKKSDLIKVSSIRKPKKKGNAHRAFVVKYDRGEGIEYIIEWL